jgi:hypothetical protein
MAYLLVQAFNLVQPVEKSPRVAWIKVPLSWPSESGVEARIEGEAQRDGKL